MTGPNENLRSVPILGGTTPEFDLFQFATPAKHRRPGRVLSTFASTPTATTGVHLVTPQTEEPRKEGSSAAPVEAPSARVDWKLAAQLQELCSERETERRQGKPILDAEVREELGRAIILEVIKDTAEERLAQAGLTWTDQERGALAKAVFDAMYRLGRFQPLVEIEDAEDITIMGNEPVRVGLADGRQILRDPVAETDEHLILQLQDLASRAVPPRVFSEATPALHLDLDGARLAATAFVTHTPAVVIRRHRFVEDFGLPQLVELGTLSPLMANFLTAGVRARMSIVVSGEQGAGKTTLLRCLCREIPAHEQIGTFETEFELGLHKMKQFEGRVIAWQARPGAGERGPDGAPVNEYGLPAELWDSLRFSRDRSVVGEVRGPEVWTMIKAMESGSGSLSSTHAKSASDTMEKLISCALEAGSQISRENAVTKLARSIQLVVHIKEAAAVRRADGTVAKGRVVDEIQVIAPGEEALGYSGEPIFISSGDGPARARLLTPAMYALEDYGFDIEAFINESGSMMEDAS